MENRENILIIETELTEEILEELIRMSEDWEAIFHFYIDELEMSFWSARLFKKTKT